MKQVHPIRRSVSVPMVSKQEEGADGLGVGDWTREAVADRTLEEDFLLPLPTWTVPAPHMTSAVFHVTLCAFPDSPMPTLMPLGTAILSGCLPCAGVRRKSCGKPTFCLCLFLY